MPPRNTDDVTNRAEARTRGLRRVRYTTGVLAAASAAGVAVLAGGYAHALPGTTDTAANTVKPAHAALSHPASTSPRTSTSPAQQTPQAKAPAAASAPTPTPTLQAPAQAPTTSASNPSSQANSGGS